MSQDFILFAALGVMIVLMIMNSRKRKKQATDLQNSVVVGAHVMLTSGIYGKVLSIDEARVTIESTPGTKLTVNRLAVRQVEANYEEPKAAAKTAAKPAAKATATKASAKPAAKKLAAKK